MPTPPLRNRARHHRLRCIETLESRLALATAVLSEGVLTIVGTFQDETFTLSTTTTNATPPKSVLTVNIKVGEGNETNLPIQGFSNPQLVGTSNITEIQVIGGGGNDAGGPGLRIPTGAA